MCEALQALINNYSANMAFYKSTRYNETETRREFIDPFFETLGWDMTNRRGLSPRLREVMPENYLTSTSRPDYAFTLSGVKKFFVEAKKPSVNVASHIDSIFQARSYGWSGGHKIVILTNFEELLIYDSTVPPRDGDLPNTALLKRYHFTEYVEKFHEISELISRDIVYSGQFERIFELLIEAGANRTIDEYFLEQVNGWRVHLAQHLIDNNPDYSMEMVNDLTQTFINQMVFMRICEDRNLPVYHRLQQTLDDENQLQQSLDAIFREADRRYNSGLFSGENIIFNLNNEIIMDMIRSLYYPRSPYVFNVIESNLLGQIYEMFLKQKLTLTNGIISLVAVDTNINRDIVITPIEIVKYIVKKTLEPLVEGKTPSQIVELRIADIACGSGVFLLEAYDFLIQYCINWYVENDVARLIPYEQGVFNLLFEDKKRILLACIYGIDIDINAVEIAKFSLLIKLLENETTPSLGDEVSLLPNLDDNIKPGNALIDFTNIDVHRLEMTVRDAIFPFDWSFRNGTRSFDAIVGNPPYVTTEDMQALLPIEELSVYRTYSTAYKQFDKYFIFIERGLQKLKDNGLLCYIIPNKFAKIVAGEKLRRLITDNSYLTEFIDFGSAHLFGENLSYSSIILLRKAVSERFIYQEVDDLQRWWASEGQDEAVFTRISYNSNIISDFPWMLVANEHKARLVNRLYEGTVPLERVANAINGIQTSAERPRPVYWFNESDIRESTTNTFRIHRDGNDYLIEKSILKPYYKPVTHIEKKVTTYDIVKTNKWIIFPYDAEGKLYSAGIMANQFPGAWAYLNANHDVLIPKNVSPDGNGRDVPHANADTWYHYGRIQHLTSFINMPKLIVKVMRNMERPFYFYDRNDWLIAAGGTAGYCAIIEKEGGYRLEFIQAALNHPAIGYLCSVIGSDFGGEFFSNGTSILYRIPIPNINFDSPEQVTDYHNIVSHSCRIYEINDNLQNASTTNRQRAILIAEKNDLINLIKETITRLYGIQEYMDIFS